MDKSTERTWPNNELSPLGKSLFEDAATLARVQIEGYRQVREQARREALEEAARECEAYRDELDKSGQNNAGHVAHRAAKRILALKDKP